MLRRSLPPRAPLAHSFAESKPLAAPLLESARQQAARAATRQPATIGSLCCARNAGSLSPLYAILPAVAGVLTVALFSVLAHG